MAKKVLKNSGRALQMGANVGTAFASRIPKSALSSKPEVIKFYHPGKELYLDKFVCFLLHEGNSYLKSYTDLHH